MHNNFLKNSIIGGYLVIVTIIIVTGAAVYYSAAKVNHDLNDYTQRLLIKDHLVDRFRKTSNNIQSSVVSLLYHTPSKSNSETIATIHELVNQNGLRLDSLGSLTSGDQENNLLQNLRATRNEYNNSREELIRIHSKDTVAAIHYYLQTEIPAYEKYQQAFDQIERGYFADNHTRGTEITKYVASSINIINLLLVLAVIIIIALGRILWLAYKNALDSQKIAETREAQLEKLLEASPDALVVGNRDGKSFTLTNKLVNYSSILKKNF